jgi:hypothetical protein
VDHAGLGALLLNDRVQLPLDRVELERDSAAGFRSDLQIVLGEILERPNLLVAVHRMQRGA